MENFRQYEQLLSCGDGLDSGNDGDCDTSGPASVNKIKVMLIVEEHLRHQEFSTGIYLAFEVFEIGFDVGCIGVLFRIASGTSTKVRFRGVGDFLIKVNACIHVLNLVNEVECVFIAAFFGFKVGVAFSVIPPQSQNIVDTQKTQFNEGIFGVLLVNPPQMRCGTASIL